MKILIKEQGWPGGKARIEREKVAAEKVAADVAPVQGEIEDAKEFKPKEKRKKIIIRRRRKTRVSSQRGSLPVVTARDEDTEVPQDYPDCEGGMPQGGKDTGCSSSLNKGYKLGAVGDSIMVAIVRHLREYKSRARGGWSIEAIRTSQYNNFKPPKSRRKRIDRITIVNGGTNNFPGCDPNVYRGKYSTSFVKGQYQQLANDSRIGDQGSLLVILPLFKVTRPEKNKNGRWDKWNGPVGKLIKWKYKGRPYKIKRIQPFEEARKEINTFLEQLAEQYSNVYYVKELENVTPDADNKLHFTSAGAKQIAEKVLGFVDKEILKNSAVQDRCEYWAWVKRVKKYAQDCAGE